MSSSPILSIVFGVVDRVSCVRKLLDSISRNVIVPHEIIVSDAGDNPCEVDWGNAQVFRECPRVGCVKGYNALFRRTTGKYVAWLNDDAEVMPGWDTLTTGFLEAYPKVGVAMSYWKDFGEPKWHWNKAFWDIPYANFGVIRRELGERLGWFDEEVDMYGSDTGLCFKTWAEGLGVVAVRGAKILHYRYQDKHRERNQMYGARDADRLHAKYSRFKPRLLEVVEQFKAMQPSPELLE